MISRNIFLFLLCNLILFFPSALKAQDRNITVFSINDKPVTVDEFVYLYKKNHQVQKAEFTKEKIEEYLDLFIKFKLKVAEAERRGLDTTAAFKKEFNTYRDELRKPYLPDSRLVDSLVQLTYERMKEEVNASHILVYVKPDATDEEERNALQKITDIRSKAMKGEDFGTLAASFSDDPSAKTNKGNLGYFTALQMVYPFEVAAYTTNVGEISQPVRTRFGFHILKVENRRPASGEVEVSHILIRTGENKNNEASKNTIFEIYDQLQKGVSWTELCSQYSEDPSSKEAGGKLKPFGVGVMASVPEFEKIAFQLQKPGEISDPFETQFGWHIIKLERKIPLPPFDEMASTLKNKVSRDERVQVSKQILYGKLKASYRYTENQTVKEKVLATADSSLMQAKWRTPQYPNAAGEALFTLNGRPVTVSSFFEYVKLNQKRNSTNPRQYMAELINNFSEAKLAEMVEEKVIATTPEYKWLLKEYYEGILLFDIMEKEVWNKASADSVGQHHYYDKNAKSYRAGERVSATMYSSNSKDHILKLKPLLEKGDSVEASELASSLKIKTETGKYEKADRITLSKIPWSRGIHLTENNNLFYLINVRDIIPPGPKSFIEARAEVISDYQTFLEKEWIQELRSKHRVKVNKKGKEAVFKTLSDEKSP
jgi:peptidyl-prolyl cis-trans isomerase SurA